MSHSALGIEPSIVALLGAGTLVAISSMDAEDYLADVEWSTLVFFMGLFVMVGALVEVGGIGTVAASATKAVEDRYFISSTVLIFTSGILSGVVDNTPYVTTMSPLVAELVRAGDGSAGANAAWWALALGGPRRERHRCRCQCQRRRARDRSPSASRLRAVVTTGASAAVPVFRGPPWDPGTGTTTNSSRRP